MSVVIGTLTIDLKANTASFSQSMDKMSHLSAKSANDIKRSLERIAVAGAAMASAVAAGTAVLISSALDSVDVLGKLAQSVGTTTERLSTLQYAADLSGASAEQMATGLEKLSKSALDAQNGNDQLEKVFARLGIQIADSNGHLIDSGVVFGQVASKFAAMQDGAGKTALAMTLFGRSGAVLIPTLNAFGAEQEKVTAEAQRFGVVIASSTAAQAGAAHDNLDRLHAVLRGIGLSALGATLPAIQKLTDQLVELAKSANIPDLARSFGGKVVTAIEALSSGLRFAVEHATALKVALEALAAIQLGRIAIPLLADLANGGLEKAALGIARFVASGLGITRLIAPLAQYENFIRASIVSVRTLAATEGIAAAASAGFGATITALGGPLTIAVGALVGLGVALYKFRESTFQLNGTAFQLQDSWHAAWILIGKGIDWAGEKFRQMVDWMKRLWGSFLNWFSASPFLKTLEGWFTTAVEFASKWIGKLTPDFIGDALKQAKAEREAAAAAAGKPALEPPKPGNNLANAPVTTGLSKPDKDPYGDQIQKLNLAIAAEARYIAALDRGPAALTALASAEKAAGIVLEINNKRRDDGKSSLTRQQVALIGTKVAMEASLKAIHDYGTELVNQQQSAGLSIQQTRALAAATLEGDEAVRKATVDNAILGLTYNKTAEQLRAMAPEIAKVRALLEAKATVDLVANANKEIASLEDGLAVRKLVLAAMTGSIEAQRQAALAAQLYGLDQEIANTKDKEAVAVLQKKRQLLAETFQVESQSERLRSALANLRTPEEQFAREADAIHDDVEALLQAQNGLLTYGQSLIIAEREQEAFTRQVDATVNQLLRYGKARDGVSAFFIDMQRQARSTASIVYEALHSAFDKLSDSLTELITGGKADFGKMFQDLGKQMLNATIKQQLQKALGGLGEKLGFGLTKRDGSSQSSALWVQMADGGGLGLGAEGEEGKLGGILGKLGKGIGGIFGKIGGALGGIFSKIGGLFGSGGSGSGGLFGFLGGLIPHADGGSVNPAQAYLVGERGPEILTGASGRIASNASSQRLLTQSTGPVINYSIDARGTDPAQTEQRTRAAIIAAHNSAVGTSFQVQQEHLRRVPRNR